MRQATRITGVGLCPLLKLEAIQRARRARTERDLKENYAADRAATFWARRAIAESDYLDFPTVLRRRITWKSR